MVVTLTALVITLATASPARADEEDEAPRPTAPYTPGSRLMKLKPADERVDWDVTLGAIYYFPFVDVQYGIGDKYSVSVVPTIFRYKYNGLTTNLAGGFVALNGYSDALFKGIWCQLGAGVFHSNTSYGIFNEPQLSIAGLVTGGYRFRVGNLSIGVAAGAEYHDLQKSKNIPHSYLLAPISWIDLGWAF